MVSHVSAEANLYWTEISLLVITVADSVLLSVDNGTIPSLDVQFWKLSIAAEST